MNRRSILALFGGGAASAVSGVSVTDAAKALGVEGALVADNPMPTDMPQVHPMRSALSSDAAYKAIWRQRDRASRTIGDMPAHIATKKSWSPVFKEAVHHRELAILDAALVRMQQDEEFAQRVATLLGLQQ